MSSLSLPQPMEEKDLPAPKPTLRLAEGHVETQANAEAYPALQKAMTKEDAIKAMALIAEAEHLEKEANGHYKNEKHPAVILFREMLTKFRTRKEANGHGVITLKTREKAQKVVEAPKTTQAKPAQTKTPEKKEVPLAKPSPRPLEKKTNDLSFKIKMPNGRTYRDENSFLTEIKAMERNATSEQDWQKIEGLKHIYWDLLQQKFGPKNADSSRTQPNNRPKAPASKPAPAPKTQRAESKPAAQNLAKPKAIKDMNTNEVADLIVEAAIGISPNKEAEKLNQAVLQISATIKSDSRLKIIPRALAAFADRKPDLIMPKLPLGQLETILREAMGVQDVELKAPKNLYDLVNYNIRSSDLKDIALNLNKMIEEAKSAQRKAA